ncbi:hypothetical protein TSOC_003275 [Tetrabaena socialis]|uniref:phytol kinase n=1 Tax=Tetrabaena socialis TaxID=47790 RepID=A0A2J8ABY7_9CHLO|nr:hypothetical protein TSOC_003275 [Tetrabaena socialis]|eukprot:PNH10026.1 hypothetical protein TSOC_003275 [Tetrabaena socialis]
MSGRHTDRSRGADEGPSGRRCEETPPPAVRAALRRLPALAGRRGDGDGALLVDPADVDELRGMLGTIRNYLATRGGAAEAQVAVLDKSAVRLAILRLIAAAVRWSVAGSGDAGHGALHCASMHAVQGLCRFKSRNALASPAEADFVQKLLRMDTLQCLSKQFAAAAIAAGVLTAPQLEYLASATCLFRNLMGLLHDTMAEGVDGNMAGWLLEVARALRDSSVLEHASRLLLLREDAGVALPSWAMPSAVLYTYHKAALMYQRDEQGLKRAASAKAEALCAALHEMLRGPCALHAALVHGVAMLCCADGGPSYGLPARLLSAALPWTRPDSSVPGALVVCDYSPTALLAVCQEGMPPTRLGRRIAVLLLLRLGRLAVSSAQAWASAREALGNGAAVRPPDAPTATGLPPQPPPQPLQQQPQQYLAGTAQPEVGAAGALGLSPLLLLPVGDTAGLGLGSMTEVWNLLAEALALEPDGWAAEAGAELWRLVAAATRRGLRWGVNNEELRWLGSVLSRRLETVLADGEPPARTCATPVQFAAAATAAGVLTSPQLEYLASAAVLPCNLVSLLDDMMAEVEYGDMAGWLRELARALRDSSVLEHASRLLLLREDSSANGFEKGLTRAAAAEAEAVRAALREVLRGPCARHAALVHGVAMLCSADGGPSYGLPARLLSAALPWTRTDSSVPGALVVCDHSSSALWAVCQEGTPPTRLGRRVAVLLLLRLARMAVASTAARALGACGASATGQLTLPLSLQPQQQHLRTGEGDVEAGASGALGPLLPPRPPLLLLSSEDVRNVVLPSISTAWRQLQEALALQPDGWAAAAGAELWRLVDAAMREGLQLGRNNEELRLLGSNLSCGWQAVLAEGEPLPPAPPPVFAVALAGGVLPCVERLLRRAGEGPLGPEASFAEGLLQQGIRGPFLVALLAYGEPRQAAAMVATLGKLLRSFGSSCLALTLGRKGVPDLVVTCVRDVLLAVLYDNKGVLNSRWVGAGQQQQQQQRQQQLARMLSYAVCEWLPPLSWLARQWIAAGAAPGRSDTWRCLGLSALVCLLPLLACRALDGGSGAVGAADEAAAGAAGAMVTVAGGWRRFVLLEVAAVPLLGDALRMLERGDAACSDDFNNLLALSCCAVAAACPEEVFGAGREGAADASWPPCGDVLPCGDQARAEPARGGDVAAAAPASSPPAAPASPRCPGPAQWRPELLRALARRLHGGVYGNEAGEALEALAVQLGAWEAGGGNPCKVRGEEGEECRERALAAWRRLQATWPDMARIAAALLPPAEARALLRTCSYPACSNLAGDSEADLRLQSCAKCAAAAYCCRACQVAHWRAGHREACALLGPGAVEG